MKSAEPITSSTPRKLGYDWRAATQTKVDVDRPENYRTPKKKAYVDCTEVVPCSEYTPSFKGLDIPSPLSKGPHRRTQQVQRRMEPNECKRPTMTARMDVVSTPPQNEASNRPHTNSPYNQTIHESTQNDPAEDSNRSPSKSSGHDATVNPNAEYDAIPE